MIKYLFVTINSLMLFFYSLFFEGGGVSLSGNFPTTMKPGSEIVVDLVIKKGSMGGFAKLQVEVPAGFTVAEVDSKGGTFSYVPGMAKWIWTGVPGEAEFTVKFKLQVDGSTSGAKTIAAKYSYVENNNKQVSEMAPVEITVGDGAVAATETKPDAGANITTPETKAPETKTEAPAATGGVSSNEPNSNVSAVRTISEAGPNEWNVNVVIKKDGIKGFARYSDVLPAGFSAKQGKTNGSSFSVADGKVKFVWVNVPTNEEIDISYTLSGTANETMLNGEFSYLENNQSKAYKLTPEKLNAAVAGNIKKTPAEENKTPETKQPETKAEPVANNNPETRQPETKSEPVANSNPPETKQPETKSEPVANNNPPETKQTKSESSGTQGGLEANAGSRKDGTVSFCVQIGAYQNSNVTASRLTRMYGLSEAVRSEMADGFNKFLIGKHNEYKTARDHRETTRSKGVHGAFVAAYNGPKRITVQEALMISNQKWYK